MTVAVAVWRSTVSRIHGTGERLDVRSEREEENRDNFKDE